MKNRAKARVIRISTALIIFLWGAVLVMAPVRAEAQPEEPGKTVAVLYFQDLGPSPEAKPLRKALAQMLITDLSRIEGLKVLQRERIERFVAETGIGESGLATAQTAVLAGRALEADYVVQGTFSATSEQVTVEVKVGSREGTAAELARTFSRPMEELMQLEQEIIEAIVEAVGVEPVLRAPPSPQEGVVSPAVAVMDFENLSTSGELDPLQAPLSDMFCATLSQIPEVTLVERARIKEVINELGLAATGLVDPQTAAKLGQLLGAQRMLVSSFVEMGGILRFDSHLIDTETGQLVAALAVSDSRDEYAGLIEELAYQVAAALSVPVPPPAEQTVQAEAPTESWEAYTYFGKGMLNYGRGRPQQALEEMLRCLYLEPDCERALDWAAIMAAHLKKVDLTVELAERIISTYSSDPDKRWLVASAYSSLRLLYVHLRQPEKQLEVIERGLAADISDEPKMSFLWSKAECLKELGRATPDVLLDIYRQLLDYPAERAFHRFVAATEAADLLIQANEMDEATAVLLKATGGPPQPTGGAWRRFLERVDKLFEYSLEKDDLESARKLVEMSIQKCPDETGATGWDHLKRAELHEAEGKIDEAIESYKQLANLRYPQSFFKAVLRIGDLHLKRDDVKAAVEAYQRLIRCGSGTYEYREATERLKDLGVQMPTPEGYQPSSVHTEQFGHATIILGDNGYRLSGLHVVIDNPSEVLCPYQIVVMEWPKGGQPWWVTQSWLNFVRRGGGLFLSMARYIHGSAARPLRTGLGVGPIAGQWGGGRSGLAASGHHPAGQGLEGLSVSLSIPLECDKQLVVATWGDHPALAAVEHGLGRALVGGFGLELIGRERGLHGVGSRGYKYFGLGRWKLEPAAEDFILPAFEWLRQEEAQREHAQLLTRFRTVADSWARKDYSKAIELLRGICSDYVGTEWEELAGYTIGEILQQSLHNYGRARQTFERLYAKFPDGDLALPARMAAADCAEATGVGTEDLLKLYAEVVELGQDSEIGATAQLKIGFIYLLAGRLEDATGALRKVANDFPAGYAKNNALYALGYCYEKTGRLADAQRIYQSIVDITQRAEPPDPVDPECFPTAWKLLLKGTKYAARSTGREWRGNVVVEGRVFPGYGLQTLAQWRLDQLGEDSHAAQ